MAVVAAAHGGLTLATLPLVAPLWSLASVVSVLVIAEWRHRHTAHHVSQ